MSRLLFVHNHPTRFVQLDLALLRERYAVREWYQRTRQIDAAGLWRAVAASEVVFGWFASWHTLWPVLMARAQRKPVVLVVGGYDSANMPEIAYGNMRGGPKKWISRTTMRGATALVTNSNYTRDEVVRNAGVRPSKVTTVYHGVESVPAPEGIAKECAAVTVANVKRDNWKRKGLEPFVRAAAFLPQVPFRVIGAWGDESVNELRGMASPNVEFTGRVDDKALGEALARAQVYVQASYHEGFGMALAEAMLSECVPVVTRAGALPEVVGDTGVYVLSQQPEAIAEGVRMALNAPARGPAARARVKTLFTMEQRRAGLRAVIERAMGGNG